MILQLEDEIPLSLPEGKEVVQRAVITPLLSYGFLLQPYRTTNIGFNREQYPNGELRFNVKTEKLSALSNKQNVSLYEYAVTYSQPQYSYTKLKETTTFGETDARFLQLPESLPPRVAALAEEITGTHTSIYDKARAIESYFRRNGFKYDIKDVPVPKRRAGLCRPVFI